MLKAEQAGKDAGLHKWIVFGVFAILAIGAGFALPTATPLTINNSSSESNKASTPTASTPTSSATPARPETADKGSITYAPPAWPEPPSTNSMLLRLFLGTLLVLGLCVATLWLGKKYLAGPARGSSTGAQMTLVESLALGNRCQVHLVRIGSREVLVGVDAIGLKSMVSLNESFREVLAEQTEVPTTTNP